MSRRIFVQCAAAFMLWMASACTLASTFEEGVAHYSNFQYQRALEVLTPHATKGHTKAQVLVGILYGGGKGVSKDLHKAEYWFRQAAIQKDPAGQYFLGLLYIDPENTELYNEKQGFMWIRRAANQGNRYAQHFLILSYTHGWIGRDKDKAKAEYWQGKYEQH